MGKDETLDGSLDLTGVHVQTLVVKKLLLIH